MYGAIPVRQPVSCFAAIWLMILTGAASPVLAQSFVSGLVYEKQGDGFRPIPHARIHARSGATGSVVGQVEADAFGHYVLADLPEGDVVLSVSHPRQRRRIGVSVRAAGLVRTEVEVRVVGRQAFARVLETAARGRAGYR